MTDAILVASFGTSIAETREKNITAVENAVAAAFPHCKIYTATTSGIVRSLMKKQGVFAQDIAAALAQMRRDGMKNIVVLPTHLLYGEEYDKLCAAVSAAQHTFKSVRIAKPLLASHEDMRSVLEIVAAENPVAEDECLVCMGHGTMHFCNSVYAALDYLAKASGLAHIFIGTVEAYPDLDAVISAAKKAGCKKALLCPLMLVAGDHALNDMAAPQDGSWRSAFEKEGFSVRCNIRGLGESAAIRALYCAHAAAAMQ